MTETLPPACQDVIRAYERLDFGGGKLVVTPYYLNSLQKRRFVTAVEAGKGSPAEIIEETCAHAITKNVDLQAMDSGMIRRFMAHEGIGVDCSGFVAHVLDVWIRKQFNRSLANILITENKNSWGRLLFLLRPLNNIDVQTLTAPKNVIAVNLNEIKPGDLVRTRGGKHVIIIEKVDYHEGRPNQITYVHSSGAFGEESGIQRGTIIITDQKGDLGEQQWREEWCGRKPSLEGWREEKEKNGIFRMRLFA